MSPVAPELRSIGPMDPDETAGLVGDTGIAQGSAARELLRRHAQAVPDEVRAAMIQPEDGPEVRHLHLRERRRTLVLSEIARLGKIDRSEKVIDAKVRGTNEDNLVVVYAIQTEDGRTAKGILPYSELEASQDAYRDALNTPAPVSDTVVGDGEAGTTSSAEMASLRKELAELREQREADSEKIDELVAAQDEAPVDPAAGVTDNPPPVGPEPLEPFDGYEEMNASQAKDAITKAADAEADQEVRDIVAYELAHKNRPSVIAAAPGDLLDQVRDGKTDQPE